MHRARGAALLFMLIGVSPARADGTEQQDQFEEKCVGRCAERAMRAGKTDRSHWVKELENAFPGRVTDPVKEEDYGDWFVLLAGKGTEWRRDETPANSPITDLFDRVVQRMELGPVPTIRREEFLRYAKKVLMQGNNKLQEVEKEQNDEIDKVFRVLDRDGNGELQREELTTKLQGERVRTDADGNGRIDKEEYRAYFRRRVTVGAETLAKAAEQGRGPDGKIKGPIGKAGPGAGLPDWFTTLDDDKDGQVSLFEWRKAGRAIANYTEMDLNGDGLLTRDEYLRFVKINEAKKKDEPPLPR